MRKFSRIVSVVSIVFLLCSGVTSARTTIQLWTLGPIYQRMFTLMMPEFEKAFPDVDLQITYNTHSADKLAVAIAGGAAPDIATQPTRTAAQFIEAGAFVPVDFAATGAKDADDYFKRFWPGLKNVMLYKGQYYFLPTEVSTFALFYNKDMLATNGIAKVPSTWQELINIGKKLTRIEDKGWTRLGVTLQNDGKYNALFFASLLRQNKTDWIRSDGMPNFSDPRSIAAIEVYAELFRSNAAWPTANHNAYLQGKAAFLPDATYQYFYAIQNTAGFEVGTAPYPVLEGGVPNATSYAMGLYVTQQSKHKELAWKIANFFTSSRFGALWLNEGGILQPYRDQWLVDALKKEPLLLPFVSALEFSQMEMAHVKYTDIEKALHVAERSIANQQLSVQQALELLDQTLAPVMNGI